MKQYLIAALAVTSIVAASACTANPPAPEDVSVTNPGSSQEFLDQWQEALISPAPVPENRPDNWEELILPGYQTKQLECPACATGTVTAEDAVE